MTTLTVMSPTSNGEPYDPDPKISQLPDKENAGPSRSGSRDAPSAAEPDAAKAPNGKAANSDKLAPLVLGKTPRRVKVYLLDGENWLDNGTGYCKGEIELDTNRPYFIVRNELDSEDVILKSFLEGTIQYQRQQETLIVWTDPSGKDLALSFQETEGCADLCEFIIKVQQQNYSPEISLYYVISSNQLADNDNYSQMGAGTDITELIAGPINYPDLPTLDNVEEILEVVNQGSSSNYSRTCIVNYVIENDYLSKLIEVFRQSELKKVIINLYALSEIIKTFILYNESSLIEDFVSTKPKVWGLVGILEYDAEFPNFKACHRDYLKDKSEFKTVIDLPLDDDNGKLNIFEKDFYLNFLKDVVLARFLDDQSFNVFSTLIHLNQIAIIDFLKDSNTNNGFLEKLFELYDDNVSADLEKRRNGIRMLHQHVLITKSIQPFQRTDFFAVLIRSGLFSMIKFALQDSDLSVRTLGTELIVSIIEQDVSLVNSIDDDGIDNSEPPPKPPAEVLAEDNGVHASEKDLRLKLSDDMTLISLLSQLLLEVKNHGLKTQAFEALKILLDSNIGLGCTEEENKWSAKNAPSNGGSNDISTEDYFQAFYTNVAPKLYADLIELARSETPDERLVAKIISDQLLYQQLCELFTFCTIAHSKTLRKFFIENDVLSGVCKLLQLDCRMTVKLSAIRCLSNLLACNDKFYYRHMLHKGILDKFFEFFSSVVDDNNLANSSCLALLEVLNNSPITGRNKHNFKVMLKYINDNYRDFCINRLKHVNTGKDLIRLYEKLIPETQRSMFNIDTQNQNGKEIDDESGDSEHEEDHSQVSIVNASTPSNTDEVIEGSPKINNLFKDIERDLNQKAHEKRNREKDLTTDDAGVKKQK